MPRRARRRSESGIYHVMLRGISRATIFYDDEDYEAFLDILTRTFKEPPGDPQEGGAGLRSTFTV